MDAGYFIGFKPGFENWYKIIRSIVTFKYSQLLDANALKKAMDVVNFFENLLMNVTYVIFRIGLH